MKTISPIELKSIMDKTADNIQLIDIRDQYEYDICCIGGDKINMYEIPDKIEEDQYIINLIKKRLRYLKIYNLPSRLIRKVLKICRNITKKFLF